MEPSEARTALEMLAAVQSNSKSSRAKSVADRLAELGVEARANGRLVEVLDPEALGRLLCRLE